MMLASEGSRAMFGGLLWGDRAVGFVFYDEAGTSEREPITIVVGIIVNADQQLIFAETAIQEALGAVPTEFRDGFVFHAKEIWGSPKYRASWPMADRLALLRTMLSLPKKLGLPVTMGMIRRNSGMGEPNPSDANRGSSLLNID